MDPDVTKETKKDVIERIIRKYGLLKEDVVVIGDDLESEIKGARELGLRSFLMDPANRYPDESEAVKGKSLKEVEKVL